METRCTHCGATTLVELEGEDTPPKSLKCVVCGETFVPVRGSLLAKRWVLRRTNGEQLKFDSLQTLQAMVRSHDVLPDDEISGTGQGWRKLRDIVELAALFEAKEVKLSHPRPQIPRDFVPYAPLQASLEVSGKLKVPQKAARNNILVFLFALVAGAAIVFTAHHFKEKHNRELQEAEIFVDDARRQLMQDTAHHVESSVVAFERATQVAPDYAPAHAWLALSLMASADVLLLDVWLSKQEIQWDPGQVALDEERVKRLESKAASRLEKSFLSATRASGLAADSVEANFVLADYFYRQSKIHDFRRHLTRIKIIDPNHVSRHYFEALSQSRPLEARLISWEELLINGPSQNRMRLKMVRFLLETKNYARAIQEVDVVLNKAPAHRIAARLRGHIVKLKSQEQLELSSTAMAEPAFEGDDETTAKGGAAPEIAQKPAPLMGAKQVQKKLQLSPLQSLLRRAQREIDAGLPREATTLYRKALILKPNNIDALAGIGFCHLEQGSLPAAYSAFKQVLRRAKDFAEAHRGLGKLWRVRGNKEKSLKHFQHYLKVLPMGSHAASVRTAIIELEAKPE
jgi:tetratricopeptide (TPR) repeat protein